MNVPTLWFKKEREESMRIVIDGIVVDVVDGDTIDVRITRTVRVRLLDCWCPETRTRDEEEKAKGIKAREYVQGIAIGEPVEVDIPIEGDARFGESMSFGRVLGRVKMKSSGCDLSEVIVGAGHGTRTRED
jgi:endonuclease YncB( thermonuclease family)